MKNFYIVVLLSILANCRFAVAQSDTTFSYTGSVQSYTVPPCVYQLSVDVKGAQGMANTDNTSLGGDGGRVQGTLSVTPGDILQIYVGGGGAVSNTGGFNGGGNGGISIAIAYWAFFPACPTADGGGGGGASDIRVSPYGLSNRVVVGGGGGGTGGDRMPGCGPGAGGGGGGGYYGGGGGGGYSGLPGHGGSQIAGGDSGTSPGCAIYGGEAGYSGVFGAGGNGGDAPGNNQGTPLNVGCIGGAGGTLTGATGTNCTGGGCPGTWSGGSGGGGSNYAEPCLASVTQTQGYQTGNGEVFIHPICGGSPLTVTLTQSNPTCGRGCNGSIMANVTGGTSPYTYSWSPGGQTNQSDTGLCGGTYTVTITDATGCVSVIDSVTLPSNSLNVTNVINSNELCFGNCVGSATASVSGGHSPYIYAWAPVGGTTNSATGLCAGTYTINVIDSGGCTGTATATITSPAAVTGTAVVNNVLCHGGTGSATVTPAGGTSPYTYLWTPSNKTTANATGLSAGTYSIVITDKNGCTGSLTATLTQPTALTATISNPTYPACHGGTGTATGAGGGGVSPYTYSWSPAGGTGATGTGLTAGTYTVTVKDNNGCTATASINITQPAVVSGNINVLAYPLCNGGTGSAQVTASGGTPNYSYLWTPTNQTNATATGLSAATYNVKITDAHGCTGSATVTMTQPATLTVTASFTHASCGLGNGTATASPSGGTNPYTYLWTPTNETLATATGLHAGSYTVTVTDKNHCTASAGVTVTQPSAVSVTIPTIANVLCYGVNDGTATASGSGGTLPYGYLWTPSGGSGVTGTGLVAGNYTVKLTDANGCTATASTSITQPAALTVSISGPQIRCLGDNGSFTANVNGGTGPYNYSWAGPNVVSPNNSVTSITPPGNQTYTVTVTDAHNCVALGYISFTFPPPLGVSITGAAVTCSGRTASLCALATGGTGGDTYLWEPVNLTSPCVTVPVSATTVYTVTVTDNCGVRATASTTIHVNPPPAVVFISNTQEGCAPMCIQFHNLTPPTGGQEQYHWDFGDGDSLLEQNPIYCYTKSGVYNVTLTVISDSGCSSTLTKTNMISVYGRPQAAFTYSPDPATILSPTIQFTDKSTDNYGLAYRWWDFGDGSDSTSNLADPGHTYKDTGSYCATLIEMNIKGCADTTTNCLVINPQYNLYIPSAFTPNGDGIDDEFKPVGQYIKSFDMYIFDRWGMQLYHTTDINQGWNGTVNGGSSISQEDTYVYKITVTDAQGNPHSYIGNVTLLK